MASNLQKAINDNTFYCTINSEKSKLWRDFHLQQGHIYGFSPELKFDGFTGIFVVYQTRQDRVILRLARRTPDCYEWHTRAISMRTATAQKIAAVNRKREGGVVVEKYDISSFYKNHLTTEPFMPMPNMRIPMGKRGKNPTVTDKVNHDFSFKSGKEYHEKKRQQKLDNVMHTLDIRIHRANRARGEA